MQIPSRPLVLGHRGAPREAPENTLRAFQVALDQGADGVELDVQPAADGTAVVIHDATLERTTDRTGALSTLGWAEVSAARAGGEPVPRVEHAVEWARATGAWLNVEVKSPGVEAAAVAAVRAGGLLERTFFSSFLTPVVAALRAEAPEASCFLLTEAWNDEVRSSVADLGVAGVCLHHPIASPDALGWLRGRGLHAVVWTVDEPERMRELFDQGVLGIITNRPAVAVSARDSSRPAAG